MGKKGFKNGIMAMLLVAMMVGMLSGCGNSSSNTKEEQKPTGTTESTDAKLDTSKEVELVMYLVSDRPAGQDVVDENLNKILKEKLNCTLKINWIGWAEFQNKYPLLFSSGEQFDLAYSSNWLNYTSLAQKGAFMSLDELWPTYAPKNFAAATDAAKQQATIDGHYYSVPTLLSTYTAYGPIYRTDIMEGTDWNGKMDTFEDIEAYCDIVKATRPELEPLDISSAGSEWGYLYMKNKGFQLVGTDYLYFDPLADKPEVFSVDQYDGIIDYLKLMASWNEKGFFSKSALSDTNGTKTKDGKAAIKPHNIDTYRDYAALHPEYKFGFTNLVKNVSHLPYTQDSMVVSNTSKNPERALAFWDLLTTDQEVYDAFFYGVLGTTYTLNDKGQFKMTDSNLYNTSAMWAARTDGLNREQEGTPDDYTTTKEEFEASIQPNVEKYTGFVFNTASVETEIAACKSVYQQYWWPLELGYVEDLEAGLKEYQAQMKAAGVEKVQAEVQRQLDEYLANLNK